MKMVRANICVFELVHMCAAGPVVWRCAVQFACNAVNGHSENAALFWDEFCPAVK